jgi:small subunit ribosomal protein S9
MADEQTPDAPQDSEQSEERETAAAQAPETAEPVAQEEAPAEQVDEQAPQAPAAETPAEQAPAEPVAVEPAAEPAAVSEEEEPEGEAAPEAPREKPAVPGAHLEVDIVPEGADPLGREGGAEEYEDPYAVEDEADQDAASADEADEPLVQPISTAAIDLASGARYRATGKRKTAIARVTLRPGTGTYLVNGRTLEQHFPRTTLQRNIRQPLETVGYEDRMDVVARLHGGGISAQAGALRHGVSRALLEADPNLRGELKRRGFLTRDSRAKERKKAGLKKARKRPQFSKR